MRCFRTRFEYICKNSEINSTCTLGPIDHLTRKAFAANLHLIELKGYRSWLSISTTTGSAFSGCALIHVHLKSIVRVFLAFFWEGYKTKYPSTCWLFVRHPMSCPLLLKASFNSQWSFPYRSRSSEIRKLRDSENRLPQNIMDIYKLSLFSIPLPPPRLTWEIRL